MSELFKFFQPRSPTLDHIPGGIPSVTAEMVAAACCGMTRQVYLYALLKWAEDNRVKLELIALNRKAAVYRAQVERWQLGEGEGSATIWRLADMALDSALFVHRCNRCRGRGYTGNHKSCRVCKGSGQQRRLGERARAKQLGVTRDRWRQSWAQRFNDMCADYDAWDAYVAARVRRQVFTDEA